MQLDWQKMWRIDIPYIYIYCKGKNNSGGSSFFMDPKTITNIAKMNVRHFLVHLFLWCISCLTIFWGRCLCLFCFYFDLGLSFFFFLQQTQHFFLTEAQFQSFAQSDLIGMTRMSPALSSDPNAIVTFLTVLLERIWLLQKRLNCNTKMQLRTTRGMIFIITLPPSQNSPTKSDGTCVCV